jgi:hypothetical protein
MGLHSGFIVATTSQARLFEELDRHTGEFTVTGTAERIADADVDWGRADLVLGERDGAAFLTDAAFVPSASPDLIVAMSAELGTVVGCGAETVSGTYWVTAARGGELLRHLFVEHAGLSRPFELGEPLPCEAEQPVDDVSGFGVYAVMADFGLDPTPWLRSGPATVLHYDFSRPPADGPIAHGMAGHREHYGRTGPPPPVTVVVNHRPRRWLRRGPR